MQTPLAKISQWHAALMNSTASQPVACDSFGDITVVSLLQEAFLHTEYALCTMHHMQICRKAQSVLHMTAKHNQYCT